MPSFSRSRTVAWSLAALLMLGRLAAAQQIPLAEVARREAERRKAIPAAAKVLTNKDLPKSPAPPPAAAPPASPEWAVPAAPPVEGAPVGRAGSPGVAAATPDAAAEPAKDEAWWRARVVKARDALARDEVLADALQSRVNALSADVVARDDPYQRARLGEDRQKALTEMARLQDEIVLLKQTLEDIEEEARKASVPPGWLR